MTTEKATVSDLDALAKSAQSIGDCDQRQLLDHAASCGLDLTGAWREAERFRAARNLALQHHRQREAEAFHRAYGYLQWLTRQLLAEADTPTTH